MPVRLQESRKYKDGLEQSDSNPFVPIPRGGRVALAVFASCYIVLVVTGNIFFAFRHGTSMMVVAASNVCLLLCVFVPIFSYRKEYGWCHPLMLLSLFATMGLVVQKTPLLIAGLQSHIMLGSLDLHETNMIFAYGNFVTSIAWLSVYAGFFFGPRPPVPTLNVLERPTLSLRWALVGVFCVVAGTFILYVRINGGLGGLALNLSRGAAEKVIIDPEIEGLGQYIYVIRFGATAALIWVAAQRTALKSPLFWAVGGISVSLLYFTTGKRGAMIFAALLILLTWMLRNRKVPYVRLMLFGLTAFMLLGVLGMIRERNFNSQAVVDVSFVRDVSIGDVFERTLNELISRAGVGSTYYPILAKVPDEVDMLYGKSYLEWLYMFIPRVFWPDKPRGVDVQAAREFYGAEWGMPAGPVGEAYWNFHIPGVVMVYFVMGIIMCWAGRILERYPRGVAIMVLYMLTIVYLEPSQSGFRKWVYAFVPALGLLWLTGMIRFTGRYQGAAVNRALGR